MATGRVEDVGLELSADRLFRREGHGGDGRGEVLISHLRDHLRQVGVRQYRGGSLRCR